MYISIFDASSSKPQCDLYCFNILKPLLTHASETRTRIENCESSVHDKETRIVNLETELESQNSYGSFIDQPTERSSRMEQLELDQWSIYSPTDSTYSVSCAAEISKLQEQIAALEAHAVTESSVLHIKDNWIETLKIELERCRSDNQPELSSSTGSTTTDSVSCVGEISEIELLRAQIAALNKEIEALRQTKLSFRVRRKESGDVNDKSIMNCDSFENSSSVQQIYIPGVGNCSVLCDSLTAGSGWTVIQRRFDGSGDFYKNWQEYSDGFGSLDGEFFIGLEKIHGMTKSLRYELMIVLTDFHGAEVYATYDNFRLGSEAERYKLKSLGAYNGTAGDSLVNSLDASFTTYDHDHDMWGGNCAKYYNSGWWFKWDTYSNLNGVYANEEESYRNGIWWWTWRNYGVAKTVQMMIRPWKK
ncbi:maker777 [Drosophila busckii]|uniref:Maker777 n=1 Tax=Drosophila busckii TaxID=30019 RepID=A0A0M4ERE1_DROBS|nr:maker777 [Drosophila busckii]